MNHGSKWQIAATAGLVFISAWAGQARADFMFGVPTSVGPRVNSSAFEYDPCISADGLELYFQSNRSGGYGDRDIYVCTRATIDDGWSAAVNLGPVINGPGRDAGPEISNDRLSLYFNSDRPGGFGNYDLYVVTRDSVLSPWGKPVNLGPAVNTAADEISASISADGLSLFFSDGDAINTTPRAGGHGGADIWVTRRASLSAPWGVPVNLGSAVNGSFVAGAPDISNDGLVLLFSGYRPSEGGTNDLWITVRSSLDAPWATPVNLGPPISSVSAADLNPSLSADGQMLYFVSFRPGGVGNSDVWQVPILPIADFDGDGKVDHREVQFLVENWGRNEPLCDVAPPPFGDGIIDMKDLTVLTQYASQDLVDPTLIACWTFDETDGIAVSRNNELHVATLVGGPIRRPDGAIGGAIELDGTDDYVAAEFNHDPSKDVLSVFAWVNGGKPGQVILAQQDAANWLLTDGTGALMTELRSGSRTSQPLVSRTVVTDGAWHRVGLVWDGMYRTLYVDGEPVAEDMQKGLGSAYGDLIIGSGKDLASGTFWCGLIDEVRIYRRVVAP